MSRKSLQRWQVCGIPLALLLIIAGCGGNVRPGPDAKQRQEPGGDAPSARKAALSGYDLLGDERRGGHTIRKHVGRSDSELRERLDQEHNISAASTWTDLAAASETVGEALKSESGKIDRWKKRGERRPNLALRYDARRVVGRSLRQGATQSELCTEAVIVLKADGPDFSCSPLIRRRDDVTAK